MAFPISVTYTFAGQTNPIPLSYLDSNFTTLVNGVNSISAGTNSLSNVSITGGTITGITALTVPVGGTGVANLTVNNVILGNGVSPVQFVAPGTSGNVLTSDGSTWYSAPGGGGSSSVPVGTVSPYAGSSAPSGWLLCYGQAISRTTYASLYAIVGTTYGTGDGSTTFNVPDLRGRAAFGKDNMGGSAANRITNAGSGITGTGLGNSGGSQSTTLAIANIPAHTHSYTAPTGNDGTNASSGGTSATTAGTTGSTGSGTAFGTMNPTLILNYIIYANV
jgi:microcystin-dependent protein